MDTVVIYFRLGVLAAVFLGGTSLLFSCKPQAVVPTKETAFNESALTADELKKVIEIVEGGPEWLLVRDVCPADIIPSLELEFDGRAYEECGKSPMTCLEKCKSGNGESCYGLAVLIDLKFETRQKYSLPLHFRSCSLGITSGCTNIAAAHLLEKPLNEEVNRCSARTFEKTCEYNDPWGCTMYGQMLVEGKVIDHDLKKGKKVLEKACNRFGEDDEACKSAMVTLKDIENHVFDRR